MLLISGQSTLDSRGYTSGEIHFGRERDKKKKNRKYLNENMKQPGRRPRSSRTTPLPADGIGTFTCTNRIFRTENSCWPRCNTGRCVSKLSELCRNIRILPEFARDISISARLLRDHVLLLLLLLIIQYINALNHINLCVLSKQVRNCSGRFLEAHRNEVLVDLSTV